MALDVIVSGRSRVSSDYRAILYENNTHAINIPPSPPSLAYDNQRGFSLSGSTDDTTPAALTYNSGLALLPEAATL